jgi:cation diffusion facilitator CzcD-associated flavoprotein CzcO
MACAPRLTAAVIGAGPAGLIALRELRAAGVDAVAIDAARSIGGVYAADRVYADALLTTSSNITSFGCFPAPEPGAPRMWSAGEYVAYLEAFVDACDLRAHIRLRTRVRRLELAPEDATDGRAALLLEAVQDDGEGAGDGATTPPTVLRVDHVVVATGLNTHALPPEEVLPGVGGFRGVVLHSSQLRDAAAFEGRRVLVVGGGESGSDVALMAARVASTSALSMRSGPGYGGWMVSRVSIVWAGHVCRRLPRCALFARSTSPPPRLTGA